MPPAGVTTPYRLHGIPQQFLDHAKRAVIDWYAALLPGAGFDNTNLEAKPAYALRARLYWVF